MNDTFDPLFSREMLDGISLLSADELKIYSWCVGLVLSEMGAHERARLLGSLLSRAIESPPDTREWVFKQLTDHLEEMSEEDQVRYVRSYVSPSIKTEALQSATSNSITVHASDMLTHLSRRLKPEAQLALLECAGPLAFSPYKPRTDQESLKPASSTEKPANRAPDGESLTARQVRAATAHGRARVALVVPEFLSSGSFLQPPIGMLLAAAKLRNAGYSVTLIDNRVCALPLETLADRLCDSDVIVVTTTPYDHIQNYFLDYRLKYSLKTINTLKRRYPSSTLIVCGAHGTVRPDIIFRDTSADIVLKGEFDYGIVPLLDALSNREALSRLPDVSCRDEERAGEVPDAQGGIAPYELVNLGPRYKEPRVSEDGSLPAYDLIDFRDYYGDIYIDNRPTRLPRWATILATRGCAHDCTFCFNFWGRRVRYRDPLSVVEELLWLERQYDVSHVFFIDFHFTQNRNWVAQFCRLARQRGVKIPWSAQARCDAVPEDLLREMAAANCHHLWFGVESFDPYMVSSMDKYHDADVAMTAIRCCRRAGIEPHLFIMLGLPGETRESINTTIVQMRAAQAAYAGVMIATPRFGTKYYEVAKKQFPQLGNDFYSLRSVRGLVGNDLTPLDLHEATLIFEDRAFIYQAAPARLMTGGIRQ